MAIRDYDAPSVECDHCAGHGWVMARRFGTLSAPDQEDCPICCGEGWRPMTPEEEAEAAERQWEERQENAWAYPTLDEQHRAAWELKRELRA